MFSPAFSRGTAKKQLPPCAYFPGLRKRIPGGNPLSGAGSTLLPVIPNGSPVLSALRRSPAGWGPDLTVMEAHLKIVVPHQKAGNEASAGRGAARVPTSVQGQTFRARRRSSILVLTLLVLALISVIVLGLLASVTAEKQATESSYQQRQALSLAMLGFQTGVAQLRDALGTGTNSWDDPYGNFATASPTFFWSVSPGLLTRWSYTNVAPQANIALFSQTSDPNNSALFNLNSPLIDGSTPIIGGINPPNVSVQTVNVLQDPSQAASSSNRIIGRYAFWIDDESAKINLNVADGTEKYTTNSLGVGYPTEVDLRVLSQGGSTIGTTEAQSIVQKARTSSFHSPREVLSVSGVTTDFYTNNIFNLTDYSRSPEINIFGQPKIALLPGLGSPNPSAYNMVINGITLLPLTEIYPTPSQLPGFNVKTPGGWGWGNWWPLAFRSPFPLETSGLASEQLMDGVLLYGKNNCAYSTGRLLANYLSGTNEAYAPITWPVFPGSSTQGFIGKYSNRQIDEIVAQILDLGGRLISSDYPFANYTDYPSYPILWDGNEQAYLDNLAPVSETHYSVAPSIFAGWLSNQWVIGMGRSPKVTRLAAEFDTEGSQGTAGTTNYTPPALYLSLWQEEWIPGNYLSGGAPSSTPPQYPNYNPAPSSVPITLNSPNCNGWVPRGPTTTTDYWAVQVLTNNQGIDFNNNTRNANGGGYQADPDQNLAQENHSWALEPDGTTYFGAGTWYWAGAD